MPTQLKEQTLVSTRDFMRHFSHMMKFPKSKLYVIVKHGRPIATVIPTPPTDDANWWEGLEHTAPPPSQPKKRVSFSELDKLRFHSGEKNLSQRIDEIVYGIGR